MSKDILPGALYATAEKSGTVKLMSDAEKILTEIEDNTAMQNLWNNYRRKFSYAVDIMERYLPRCQNNRKRRRTER